MWRGMGFYLSVQAPEKVWGDQDGNGLASYGVWAAAPLWGEGCKP